MKKKKTVILPLSVLVISLLFLFGCQQTATTSGYYKCTGNKAIEARFAPDAPESTETSPYTKGDDILVSVELTNKLPEDVQPNKIKLRLVGDAAIKTFFTGAKESTNPRLDAVDANCASTPDEISLGPLKYVGDISAKTSKIIKGQYCYDIPVKVKAFLYYTDKLNEIGTNLPAGSNPASSVQVVTLEQEKVRVEGSKGTMDLRVTVKNVGNGMLVEGLSDCFKYEERPTESLNMKVEGAYPVTCETNKVTLKKTDKARTIKCTVNNIEPTLLGPDPSELTITLDGFAYQEDISPVNIWVEP